MYRTIRKRCIFLLLLFNGKQNGGRRPLPGYVCKGDGTGITLDRNPKSFLLSIACKLWKNKRRKDLNAGRLFCREDVSCINENDFQMRHENSAEAIAMQNDTNARIQNAVRKLPEKLKITALLYYMEERSVEEIADILHIPKGTVKSRLFQARKRLYKELEEVL